jgi:transposase InsO family protein
MPRIGGRKLYYLLQKHLKSLGVGRDRLFAIMKANHLLIKPTRTYHITTNSHHRFRKHKNLIEQLTLTRPEQLWVSDITYVGNRDNPMYLALVTDAYSKKVLGYDLSNSLQSEGTLRALRMALGKRRYKNDKLIHHSDRGFQYCSHEYQKVLTKANVTCSMTESYDPYANAVAERINGILKHEFILDAKPKDLDVMKKLIQDSINIYNTKRPHYSCNYLTPNQMHLQNETKVRTYKTKNGSKNVFAAI